jgi:hypothetical protein
MKRTPDIREFKKEHLLEISDVLNYIKNGFNVEPCIPQYHVFKNTVNEPVGEVKINVDEEEKSKLIDTSKNLQAL